MLDAGLLSVISGKFKKKYRLEPGPPFMVYFRVRRQILRSIHSVHLNLPHPASSIRQLDITQQLSLPDRGRKSCGASDCTAEFALALLPLRGKSSHIPVFGP